MLEPSSIFERAIVTAVAGATHYVNAPAGELGLSFEDGANKGVMISAISEESPIRDYALKGWLLLAINDKKIPAGNCNFAKALLHNTASSQTRILKILDHEAEAKLLDRVYEAWTVWQHVTVDAPPGKLGIQLTTKENRTVVSSLSPTSPLRGLAGLTWTLLSIDDLDVSGMGATKAAEVLAERAANEKRVLKFDAEQHKKKPWAFGVVILAMLGASVYMILRDQLSALPLVRMLDESGEWTGGTCEATPTRGQTFNGESCHSQPRQLSCQNAVQL